jgi:hypothetical protein
MLKWMLEHNNKIMNKIIKMETMKVEMPELVEIPELAETQVQEEVAHH